MAPVPGGIFARLKTLYTGEKEPEIPPISTGAATALLVVYTLLYVLPLYTSSKTRPSPTLSRDAPSVIRARVRSVSVSCIVVSCITFTILCLVEREDITTSSLKALHWMGYLPIGGIEAIKSVTLTAILFIGPLFEAGIAEGAWRDWIHLRGVDVVIRSWIGWRNMIAGPVTEEILFRSASVPLLLLSKASNNTTIFLTPIVFGLAHVHHFYEFRITHPHTPVLGAILRSLLQFTYTTLFGGYATFVYLRTGSVVSAILIHTFCNWMGFPRFWGRVTTGETLIGPDVGEGKRSEDKGPQIASGQPSLLWTIAYYILLIVGAMSWWRLLWPLTQSESALAKF